MTELAKRIKKLGLTLNGEPIGEYELSRRIVDFNKDAMLLYQLGLIDKRNYNSMYNIILKALDKAEELR